MLRRLVRKLSFLVIFPGIGSAGGLFFPRDILGQSMRERKSRKKVSLSSLIFSSASEIEKNNLRDIVVKYVHVRRRRAAHVLRLISGLEINHCCCCVEQQQKKTNSVVY